MNLPECLESKKSTYLKYFATVQHPLSLSLQSLLLVSNYACRQIEILTALLSEDDCLTPLFYKDYQNLADQQPMNFHGLRRFRQRHFLRLLLRELGGLATTEETMASWSDCADVLILKALALAQDELSKRYGRPSNPAGKPTSLYVLAMGKLGGRELNFSSDIDLIFAFSEAGYTDGGEKIENQQFYTKVIQHFIRFMQNQSVDGFVFRVDLRLRPNGESGALVSSLAAMEIYYQEQGRDWERYAMVKARVIGEHTSALPWFQRLIIPFVYRRYIDFSVIDSLRSMKAMIEREVCLNPMLDDIKRGLGGIREVEFIVQNFQLIRGGQLPQLRKQNTVEAILALKAEQMLPHAARLKKAYLFLRKLENALQSLNDQQTHSLPQDDLKQTQIAFAMDFENWPKLLAHLKQNQNLIASMFRSVLHKKNVSEDEEKRLITKQMSNLWQGHIETTMAVNLLSSLGFQNAAHCYQMLSNFRHSPRCRRLTQSARLRLDQFMPLLLTELIQKSKTETILLQVLKLLEHIVGRSAYLALLTENPPALKEVLYWISHGPFISSLVVSHPFLLETFLEKRQKLTLPSIKTLRQTLQTKLFHCEDEERQGELLRQFKLMNWIKAGRAAIEGDYDAVRIARFLADLAEVIVGEVLRFACQQLALRYPELNQKKLGIAIIAYGKLGSREMNFNSDLDLVFVHSAEAEQENLMTRLSQNIIHRLTTGSQAGMLYAVDTRLRPSGSSGLLVSRIDSFIDYQKTSAWTWEHQALLRARVLTGDPKIQRSIKQLKKEVLFLPRNRDTLRDEVLAMRAKINRYTEEPQVKYAAGGLIDLEFLVQFLVLANPRDCFSGYTHTLSLLQHLYVEKVLEKKQWIQLKNAYQLYHQYLQQTVLQLKAPTNDFKSNLEKVIEIMRCLII